MRERKHFTRTNAPCMCTKGSIIALKECSAGNETVGDMWIEAKSFPEDTPLSEVVKWGDSKGRGRLMITSDQSNQSNNQPF